MKLHLCLIFSLILMTQLAKAQSIIIGQGQSAGVVVTTSDNANNTDGNNTLNSQGFLPNLNAASRFLSQSTFGPNYEQIEELSTTGMENWIDQQLGVPRAFSLISKVEDYKAIKISATGDSTEDASSYYWDFAWWQYAMTSPDPLRQRIALALSEFFVISEFSPFGDNAYALATYYDLLLDNAFLNYKDLLTAVTFHAAMGEYLTYMKNPKSDTIYKLDWDVWPPDTLSVQYVFPDENYAREVMQLFSIGLCQLNLDGSCQKDANGVDIPTYDNEDIAEFAKIFTGFSYGDNTKFRRNPPDWEETYKVPMQIYDDFHEPGPKYLLNGEVVNTGSGMGDVMAAIDNIAGHPNVGPFLGKFLIQRLVTSNPSPGYVTRVAQAFNGEGPFGTVRGDMKAVIKAILLDEEARNCGASDDDHYGMLREPFVRYVQLAKAFDLYTESGNYRNAMTSVYDHVQQKPLTSPSVFNFFQSDYQPIGKIEEEGKVAPEFQITNTQTISGYFNGLNDWVMRDRYTDEWRLYNNEPDYSDDYAYFNFEDEKALVDEGRLPQLLERLNLILAHGKLSQATMDAIIEAVIEWDIEQEDCIQECTKTCAPEDTNCIPGPTPQCISKCEDDNLQRLLNRVRLAVYLVMASPEYLINR